MDNKKQISYHAFRMLGLFEKISIMKRKFFYFLTLARNLKFLSEPTFLLASRVPPPIMVLIKSLSEPLFPHL